MEKRFNLVKESLLPPITYCVCERCGQQFRVLDGYGRRTKYCRKRDKAIRPCVVMRKCEEVSCDEMHSRYKYCSDKCRDRYYNHRRGLGKESIIGDCEICGKSLDRVGKMYCSNACKQIAYRRRKKDTSF